MSRKKKIGWQKYEDVIEAQVSSPFLRDLLEQMNPPYETQEYEYGESDKEEERFVQEFQAMLNQQPAVTITEEMISDISMLANFDCWVGHTNFDITPSVFKTLNKTMGVEVLKVCSRYRFFLGVGKMFDFKEVRKEIEKLILQE